MQRVFIAEVERQTRFAILAAADLEHALNLRDMDRFWYSTQSLLVAVGIVSKFLWPNEDKHLYRGKELRAALNVDEDSPLNSRTFRNHFEHIDERLESWAVTSKDKEYADLNIDASDFMIGVDSNDLLRNYDTSSRVITFRGDTYELGPVIEAIEVLHRKAHVLR